MKSFMNARRDIVTEAIEGFLHSSGGTNLARLDGFPDVKVVLRTDWDKSKVAIISGGGSGHEPAHAGFVGEGMLTAAVCGEIFASPGVDAVLAAIVAVTGDAGCLLIVKNYTGDRLNFGLAAERAKALGLKVEMLIVGDDIALPDFPSPRGIAGTLFVHKLAGASAAAGDDLHDVLAAATDAAANVRSLGLALTNCHVPGASEDHNPLGDDQVELGLGIHGEQGVNTIPFAPADQLVKAVADVLMETIDNSSRIALLVNSLGATTPLEMGIVLDAVRRTSLIDHVDFIVGPAPLMTALDMRGFSLSVLVLNPQRQAALTRPVGPVAWPLARKLSATVLVPLPASIRREAENPSANAQVGQLIATIASTLSQNAAEIDAMDAKVGDGDTGSTLATAADAVISQIALLPLNDTTALLRALADRLLRTSGGSIGALFAILFTAAGTDFAIGGDLPRALLAGLQKMKDYGGAKRGDRTMIDALEPALSSLQKDGDLTKAALAARAGANATALLAKAGAGRSAYVPSSALAGVIDPGAEAVARVFEAIAASTPGKL